MTKKQEPCHYCKNSKIPGVLMPMGFDDRATDPLRVYVAKCDECGIYHDDFDAANEVARITGWDVKQSFDRDDDACERTRIEKKDTAYSRPYFARTERQACLAMNGVPIPLVDHKMQSARAPALVLVTHNFTSENSDDGAWAVIRLEKEDCKAILGYRELFQMCKGKAKPLINLMFQDDTVELFACSLPDDLLSERELEELEDPDAYKVMPYGFAVPERVERDRQEAQTLVVTDKGFYYRSFLTYVEEAVETPVLPYELLLSVARSA